MAKVELKSGDFFLMSDISSEEELLKMHQEVRNQGFSCSYPQKFEGGIQVIEGNRLLGSSFIDDPAAKRQLTIAQVLGEDDPAMPEVGSRWSYCDERKIVEVVGHHDGRAVCFLDGEYISCGLSYLKPLKSEREKAVEEMMEEMHDVVMYTTPRGYITPATAKLLYDAGYRKVES